MILAKTNISSLGLLQLKGQFPSQWNIMMAASTLMTIPALVLFFFGQKYFIQGISLTSGSKGWFALVKKN